MPSNMITWHDEVTLLRDRLRKAPAGDLLVLKIVDQLLRMSEDEVRQWGHYELYLTMQSLPSRYDLERFLGPSGREKTDTDRILKWIRQHAPEDDQAAVFLVGYYAYLARSPVWFDFYRTQYKIAENRSKLSKALLENILSSHRNYKLTIEERRRVPDAAHWLDDHMLELLGGSSRRLEAQDKRFAGMVEELAREWFAAEQLKAQLVPWKPKSKGRATTAVDTLAFGALREICGTTDKQTVYYLRVWGWKGKPGAFRMRRLRQREAADHERHMRELCCWMWIDGQLPAHEFDQAWDAEVGRIGFKTWWAIESKNVT